MIWKPTHLIAVAAMAVVGAGPTLGQERLETLPGALLLHSQDPETCLAPVDGNSPLDAVLQTAAGAHPNLRAIAFELKDVLEASRLIVELEDADILTPNDLAGEIARASRFTDWRAAQPDMTFLSFPDDIIVGDWGMCPTEASDTAPKVAMQTARAWMMPVRGTSSAPELGLPADLPNYLATLSEQQVEGGYLAACMLLGGSLSMQPAYAGALAAPVLNRIEEDIGAVGLASGVSVRLARGLFSPMPLKLRGWDAVLLADVLEGPPELDHCFVLTEEILGENAAALPALGSNPFNNVVACPDDGLSLDQTLRVPIFFETRSAALAEGDDARITEAVQCALGAEAALDIRVEGFASQSGSLPRNRNFARERATAVTDIVTLALEKAGRCKDDECEDVHMVGAGFSETAIFLPPDANTSIEDSNQIAILSLTPTESSLQLLAPQPLTTAAAQLFLSHQPSATCKTSENRPATRGQSLMSFLTSRFGRDLIAQLKAPNMVLVLHNQPDATAFAESLQVSARADGSCGNSGGPHIGYFYTRTGPNFEAGKIVPGPQREDYFILPPKLTWIYPLPDQNGGPDLTGLAQVASDFTIVSENNVAFNTLADPAKVRERNRWLNQVDILPYEKPVPISEVLDALAGVQAGTGWVNLTAGWE